jgi:hypothetical protein
MMIPLSGRVPGIALEPSRTRVDDGGGYGTFHGWRLRHIGFSRGCEFMGRRASWCMPEGPTPWGGVARGWPTPPLGVAGLLPYFVSPSDSMNMSGK